jgi:anti-sigma factor RsiW
MSPMQCREAHEALSSLIDGENAADQQQAAAAHVAACPLCTERTSEYRRMGEQLRTMGRVATPPDLSDRIRARLAEERGSANDNARFEWRQFSRQAAALTIVAGLSGLIGWQLSDSAAQKRSVERDVVSAHARSLLQESAVQVASSESHTVKPWFNGRIEFAPTVKDLTAEGFPLIGGRLDLVDGRRTATLVYKRRAHIINVFMWPAASSEATSVRPASLQGYNVISWTAGGLTYWAVSDLNAKELGQLQTLL